MSPMKQDFLSLLIGGQNRARVLRVFIFNAADSFTAAQIGKRSRISAKAAEVEIKVLERAGIIKKGMFSIQVGTGSRRVQGNQKEQLWTIDQDFKYLRAVTSFVHEVSPVQGNDIVAALKSSGRLTMVVLSGAFMGDISRPADIIIVADSYNEARIERAIKLLEPEYGREIRYAVFSTAEFRYRMTVHDRLIRDTLDYPHLVLLDKTQLL